MKGFNSSNYLTLANPGHRTRGKPLVVLGRVGQVEREEVPVEWTIGSKLKQTHHLSYWLTTNVCAAQVGTCVQNLAWRCVGKTS